MHRGTRTAAPASLRSWILRLHRSAGNRAVRSLLQRDTKWSDASKQGKAWNAGERQVGKVRRIPLEGLGEGLRSGHKIPELSSEGAGGKAIVLVPAALDATGSIEVVVFLHGYTEGTHRPYAGWRQLVDPKPSTAGFSDELKERLPRLRQGIDKDDTAPVRDVALDQVAQQLEESGQTQLVIVLPQGGLRSEFGKDGTQSFNAKRYVAEIVTRLKTEGVWSEEPHVRRVTMAGHSGAGAALSGMASAGELKGDLVIYDAINGSQLEAFKQWTLKRLEEDFAKVTDPGVTDEGKLWYLNRAQKLRGYTTDIYIKAYIALDEEINRWFTSRAAKLGPWAACLRANYTLEFVDVSHEELMRGSLAGKPRAAGTGTIVDAIRSLHPPRSMNTRSCPPMPRPLKDRYAEATKAKR